MQQLKAASLDNLCLRNTALIEAERRGPVTPKQGKSCPSPNLLVHRVQTSQIFQALLKKNLAGLIRQFLTAHGNNSFLIPARLTRIARLGRSSPAIDKSKPVNSLKLPASSKPIHSLQPDQVDSENHIERGVVEADGFPLIKNSAPPASFSIEQSPSLASDEKGDGACDGLGIGGRCVLCVGGRAALYPEYRRVVEASGGRLVIYRNMPQGPGHHLPVLLAHADMVVCPVDCVNHTAFFAVKRYCRRSRKPCVLLACSNLSTFRKGIATLAASGAPPASGRPA